MKADLSIFLSFTFGVLAFDDVAPMEGMMEGFEMGAERRRKPILNDK